MADDWSNHREEVTYQEARTVIDHQLTTLSDIDDKALRTVRLTVVLVGVVATAIQTEFVTNVHAGLLGAGAGLLFVSLGFGMATYSESDLFLGPGESYINQLAGNNFDDNESWNTDLLTTMGEWIDENHEDIQWNGFLLTVTEVSLFLGLLCVAAAILI